MYPMLWIHGVLPNYQCHAFSTISALIFLSDVHARIAIGGDIIMRPVISIPHSAPSIPPRLFCLYFAVKWNCDVHPHCPLAPFSSSSPFLALFLFPRSLTLRFSFSLLLSHPFGTLLPPFRSSEAVCARPFYPTSLPPSLPDSLFRRFFSPYPKRSDPSSPLPTKLFLICYTAIPSPSVLLPTGPHENTYFTGIHDGRRASVRTCLPGYL